MKIKNRLIEAGILTIVFVVAVIGFSYFTNKGNNNMTADMGAATYPQISFAYDGYALNSVPGYAKEMEIPVIRDTLTPVNNQRLDMDIKSYENAIESLDYYVYTLDGKDELLKDTIKKPGNSVTLELKGTNLLEEERVLKVVINLEEGKSIFYYTRIADAKEKNVLECLDYINNFHKNALKKAEGTGVGKALEPNEEGDNTTFRHVTIHSDYNHVTWGELEPLVEGGERWSITELNKSSMSAVLEYNVRCKGEENEDDVYKVREFFRVRHIPNTPNTYLLDYDRTMDQIFDPVRKVLNEKGVVLGIADYQVPYLVNKDGTIVSFVQADELWSYNKNTDEISLVFSFASAENTDTRNQISRHKIRLLDVDANGNVTFAVYGYMNRGAHEGEVGVAVYYYNVEKSSVNEKVFISTNESYGVTVQELGKLVYYNIKNDMLYVVADGTFYKIDVKKEKEEILIENLEEEQFVVSDDGHMIAYQMQEEKHEATQIRVLNLLSGKERMVECEDGETIHPLGFMGNDFVYGVARTKDVGQSVSGEMVVPMYKVEIQNSKSRIVKTYKANNIYVLNAEFSNNMITLKRVTKKDGMYTNIVEDYITNNEERAESNIYLESYATELKQTQMRLRYNDGITDKEPKILKPKQVLMDKPVTISLDNNEEKHRYFVYGYGELQGIYDRAGDAVIEAKEYNGVVVSEEQDYVWVKGNRDLQYSIQGKDDQIAEILSLLENGTSPIEIMDNISGGRSLDLTGCPVEDILYVINQDKPVIAMLDAKTAVVLVGYGEKNVTYIDSSNQEHSVSFEEMEKMTKKSGHTYIG